jgi:hypothetical protein
MRQTLSARPRTTRFTLPFTRPLTVALLLAALLALAGCSTTEYNNTAFHYEINRELLAQKPVKRIVLASSNFSGEPTRYHLQKGAARVDSRVRSYLQANGYEIVPSHLFDNAWNQAIRTYGEIYDPTTGRVDTNTWRAVMISTAKSLQEQGGIDAILFTDVIEHDAAHNIGLDHLAQWYGVSRKPGFARAGDSSVPSDFDWNRTIKVATLSVVLFNMELQPLFNSRAGLDTLQVIDSRGGEWRYVRRKKILENDRFIDEGIALAFHPLVPIKNYPIDGR